MTIEIESVDGSALGYIVELFLWSFETHQNLLLFVENGGDDSALGSSMYIRMFSSIIALISLYDRLKQEMQIEQCWKGRHGDEVVR